MASPNDPLDPGKGIITGAGDKSIAEMTSAAIRGQSNSATPRETPEEGLSSNTDQEKKNNNFGYLATAVLVIVTLVVAFLFFTKKNIAEKVADAPPPVVTAPTPPAAPAASAPQEQKATATATATVNCTDHRPAQATSTGDNSVAIAKCSVRPRVPAVAAPAATRPAVKQATDKGKLVFVKCNGDTTVVGTTEPGTKVQLVGDCRQPTVSGVVVEDRRIGAGSPSQPSTVPVQAAPTTPSGEVSASSLPSTANAANPLLWHAHDATAASPKPCIISGGDGSGLPPYCSGTAKVVPLNAGESKNQWLVRVGGGSRPTDTGFYQKKD